MRPLLVVAGVWLGLVGAVLHRHSSVALGVDWPWGLVVAVAGTFAVVRGADQLVRLGSAWIGVGWGIAVLAQQLSPGGSYLVASDLTGWAFMLLGAGVVVISVVRTSRLAR